MAEGTSLSTEDDGAYRVRETATPYETFQPDSPRCAAAVLSHRNKLWKMAKLSLSLSLFSFVFVSSTIQCCLLF
jgi:hypothetical protein